MAIPQFVQLPPEKLIDPLPPDVNVDTVGVADRPEIVYTCALFAVQAV